MLSMAHRLIACETDPSKTKSGKLQKLGGGQKIFIFRWGGGGGPMRGGSEKFHFHGGGGYFSGGRLIPLCTLYSFYFTSISKIYITLLMASSIIADQFFCCVIYSSFYQAHYLGMFMLCLFTCPYQINSSSNDSFEGLLSSSA